MVGLMGGGHAPAASPPSCSTSSCLRRRRCCRRRSSARPTSPRRAGPTTRSPPSAPRRIASTSRSTRCPTVLQAAVLATEDRDFYEHGGVDPVGIGRALYNDLRGSGVQQGGSTITQQYVKNVYLTSERSIGRKLKEAVLGGEARARAREGRDPRALPQHHLLRPGRLRRRGGHPRLLRQGRARDRSAGGLVPGRADPLAGRGRRAREPGGGHPAAQHRPGRHGRGGLHHRGGAGDGRRLTDRDERGRPRGPHRPRSRRGRRDRHQVLRGGRAAPGGRAATARTRSTAAASASTRPSTSTCSERPGTRSPRRSTRRATRTRHSSRSTSTAT